MMFLSAAWKMLGIKGAALIAIAAIAGVLWLRLHIADADLTGARGQLAAQQAAQVSQLASIDQLTTANAAAAKLLTTYRADLAYSRQVAAGLAAQNHTLAARSITRQQQVAIAARGNACAAQVVPAGVMEAVCGASGCTEAAAHARSPPG